MYPRLIEHRLKGALSDTRVVLLSGPRQAGKTTLVRKFAGADFTFLTFDDPTTLVAARRDPVGFVRELDRAIIDEIQRVPEILLAIKQSVDEDKRPGRFLLTGSANLMTLPQVADSLAGRMTTVDLLPLAQAELQRTSSSFLGHVFAGKAPTAVQLSLGNDLLDRVIAGGYPEAVGRDSWARRKKWHLDYIKSIVQRDVREIAQIEQIAQMPRLLRVLAHHSGQLVNYSSFGAPLGMTHVTTQKYAGIFEQLFLLRTLPPWFSSGLKRLIKTPKLHFLDSGLLAALQNLSPQGLRSDRNAFGPLLESFVVSEVLKLATWKEESFECFHFRDKEQNEVDLVLEDSDGRIVGIEVKAAATATARDFGGLRKLAETSGSRFALGLVLYDHDRTVPFGAKMWAAPISSLWG